MSTIFPDTQTSGLITVRKRGEDVVARLMMSEDVFATTLAVIVVAEYGTEALEWAIEAIVGELQDDHGGVMPRENVAKLAAAVTILMSDDFYKRPPRFVSLCNMLAGHGVGDDWDMADAMECAWGITEAGLLDPPDDNDEEPFVLEILRYIGHVLDEEGIVHPPDVLNRGIRETNTVEPDYDTLSLENPAAFAAEYNVAEDKSEAITLLLKENSIELSEQLQLLPHIVGQGAENLAELIKKLRH